MARAHAVSTPQPRRNVVIFPGTGSQRARQELVKMLLAVRAVEGEAAAVNAMVDLIGALVALLGHVGGEDPLLATFEEICVGRGI
jgi:hypothetical protein